jgi:hypothetical protein
LLEDEPDEAGVEEVEPAALDDEEELDESLLVDGESLDLDSVLEPLSPAPTVALEPEPARESVR